LGSRASCDSAFRGHTRLAHWMTSAIRAAFATTQRVVDRVHRLGARVGTNPHVTRATRLAKADVDPVEISELADRGRAGATHTTHFATRKDDDRVDPLFRAKPSNATSRSDKLAALAGVHFDVVDLKSAGDVRERQAVADFRRSIWATDNLLADAKTIW